MFRRLTFLFAFLVVVTAAPVRAQNIVLKDGTRVAAADLNLADGKITRNITLSNGVKAQASVELSDILLMEWSNPKELVNARNLMAAGKAKEAVAVLQQGKDYFRQFKSTKGNPYNELVFAQIEALDQSGDFDAIYKVMPEVNGINWGDDKKIALRIIKLNLERRTTPDQEKFLTEAESLREETDDTSARAKLSMTIGDIYFKKERWTEAFDSYLRVPVFYGSQTAIVPQAELGAARCLVKMERYKDAAAMFERISQSYPGSDVGDTAKKEFLANTGRDNKPDKPPQSGNDSPKKPDEKAKS
ncbi:MAG: tetratricopeptide repeat protein [Verrucomicrobia bacterium]|nr:tetratricopeptide repeat protein [Verrucomicrobiota bacterium]